MKKQIIMSAILGAIYLCNISMVDAKVPDNIVLIGEKAYDLEYANDNKNIKEIMEEVRENSDRIFIKVNDKWFSNKTANLLLDEPSAYFNYKNDVYIVKDNCKVSDLEVKGDLNIEAEGVEICELKVKNEIKVAKNVNNVIFSGNSSTISVQPNNTKIIIESGIFEEINIEGNCTINLGKEARIDRLITNDNDVKIQGDGKNNIGEIQQEKNVNTEDKNVYSDKRLIEVKTAKEKDYEDIINLYIKGRNIEDFYGIQMDVKYDTSALLIEDIYVDELLSDKLNIKFKDYKGNASCIAFLTGDVKGLNINDDLIKIKIRLLNRDNKRLNICNNDVDSDSDLKLSFKLSNNRGKEIIVDNIEISE